VAGLGPARQGLQLQGSVMGCDIHMVLERQFDGVWVGINTYTYLDKDAVHISVYKNDEPVDPDHSYIGWKIRDRNYEFFAGLAGVRGDGPDPLGVPDDASLLARAMISSWGMDGHSHTYIGAREFGSLYFRQREENVPDLVKIRMNDPTKFDERIASLLAIPFSISEHHSLDWYRLIIWFDN
jgi:hypothetical protein